MEVVLIITHALEGSRRKLRRAEQHVHELHVEVAAWINGENHRKVIEMSRDDEWHTVLYSPPQGRSPEMLPLICGDAIQNMRTALDYAICDLVRAAGKKVSRQHAWPICHSPNDFTTRVKDNPKPKLSPLHGIEVDGQAWAVIEQAQPYNRPLQSRDDLAILGALSNRDKHKALYIQMLFTSSQNIKSLIGWSPYATPDEQIFTHQGPLPTVGQTELMRLRFPPNSEAQVHVKGNLGVAPYFANGPTSKVDAVAIPVPFLTALVLRAEEILDSLGAANR